MMNVDLNFEKRSPELKAAQVALDSVQKELAEAQTEKAEKEARITSSRHSSIEEKALSLLRNEYVDESTSLASEIDELDRAIAIRERAVEIQLQKIDHLKGHASMQICRDLQPEYRQIVAKMRTAVEALIAAMTLESTFISELLASDVTIGHLGRAFLPRFLNRESLEYFLEQTKPQ
jgi:hypothetical protein